MGCFDTNVMAAVNQNAKLTSNVHDTGTELVMLIMPLLPDETKTILLALLIRHRSEISDNV